MQPASVGHNSKQTVRFELVTTPKQWLHACAVRSICFMEENGNTADWLFDANDYQASHMIAYHGEEPVGSARVRWFKDFAKVERTCFRKSYRTIAVLKAFGDFGFTHIARKGYTRVITHAGPRYVRLWKTVLGFQDSAKAPAQYEGHEPYFEIWKDLQPPANMIGSETECMVLFRTEGYWDEPGAFEQR